MNRAAPRHVWVSGASRGIGAALAAEYVAAGATVSLCARDAAALGELCSRLGPRARAFPADVTRADELAASLAGAEAAAGPIDLAILNAGTYVPGGAFELHHDAARTLFELNVLSVVAALEWLLPRLRARRAGQVAVVGSVAGDVGLPRAGLYAASKAAVERLCESLQPELAAEGVAISIVKPGFVATPLTARNDFPMPFMVSAERAAREIRTGLAAGRFEIRFPRRMSLVMRLLAALPAAARFAVTRRMLRPEVP